MKRHISGLPARTSLSRLTRRGICFSLTNAQRDFQAGVRSFARIEMVPQSRRYDESGEFPAELFRQAWERGFVNIHVPPAYGGPGLGAIEGVLACEELAYADIGMMIGMEINSVAEIPVIRAGTDDQKRRFLSRMMEAPLQAAYAVTESYAGSDVAGVQTKAERRGGGWVLNGAKMWISNGGVASWYFVLARTGGPKEAPGSAFTAFLVEGDSPGVTPGRKEAMLGQRCSDTRGVAFEDVYVPDAHVLGAPGQGFRIAMGAFDLTRPPVAAAAVGLARRALDEAVACFRCRSPEQQALDQADAFAIADAATGVEAGRLLALQAAWLADEGRPNTAQASMAKLLASEQCRAAVATAMQISGITGLAAGSVTEKLFRDAPILTTYEGTSQIQRLIISRELLSRWGRGAGVVT